MRRSALLALLLTVGVAVWLASPFLVERLGGDGSTGVGRPVETAPEPVASERAIHVRTRQSAVEPMAREIVLNGRTQANRSVRLAAEGTGMVVEVLKDKGDAVAAGEVVVRLDRRDREAALAEAQATLAQRRIEDEAARRLGERGFQADTRVAEARAALEQARYMVRRAEVALEHTVQRAPFAGVLEERPVELGSFLDVGDMIGTVVELDPLLVVTDVPESVVLAIRPGEAAEVRLMDGRRLAGRVRFVARQANAETRTFRVEIALPNPDLLIPAGISTEVAIVLDPVPAHLVSPGVLVLDDAGVLGIKSVAADSTVVFHPAQLVRAEAATVWLGGLPESLEIITVGQGFVRPGQLVVATPEDAVAALVGEPGEPAGGPAR